MLKRGISWTMGARYLRRQGRQTALAVLAGAIGAMLLAMSMFHYGSVRESGQQWLSRHFGPVDFALAPSGKGNGFTAERAQAIAAEGGGAGAMPYRYLPVASVPATLFASPANDAQSASLPQALAIGFETAAAASFEPGSRLWDDPLRPGEALLDAEAAEALGLVAGDVVYADAPDGTRHGFKLRDAPPPSGLSGYRGEAARQSGTLVLHPDDARRLAGLPEGSFSAILATRMNPADSVLGMSMPSGQDGWYQTRHVKQEALGMTRSNLVVLIGVISLTAIFSSAFLLRQIVLMLADSRAELYGVLRAIGLSRKQARSLFRAEALLLGLLSGLTGIAAGLAAGWGLVKAIYGSELGRTAEAAGIPIEPHLPLPVLLVGAASVLLLQMLLVLAASRLAGSGPIVGAMRGSAREGAAASGKAGRSVRRALAGAAACVILALQAHQTWSWEPAAPDGLVMLRLAIVWIASAAALTLLLQLLLQAAGARLGPRAGTSVLLALRYSGQRPGRTFAVMLLFAVAMMTITFTSGLSSLILSNTSPANGPQGLLGYSGFAAYESEREKQDMLELLRTDETLREAVDGHVLVQPAMASATLSDSSARSGQTFVPVRPELVQGGDWKLLERASAFASDQEAWAKVMADKRSIILPRSFKDYGVEPSGTFAYPEKRYRVGDTIELGFYRDAFLPAGQPPDLKLSFTIAGFAEPNTSNSLNAAYVYDTTYVHPDIWRQLREGYHRPWDTQKFQGLILLQLDPSDLKRDEEIVSRLLSGGASAAAIPYLDTVKEHASSTRLVNGFLGFTALSAAIGLLGLAVLQRRSMLDRERELAMLRCAGVSAKALKRALMLEGSLLGLLGLLAGVAAGWSGAIAFARVLQSDLRPLEKPLPVDFDGLLLGGILLTLAVLAVLLQAGPARSALRGTPVESLRRADA
ncbi:FtsX-like permease family protein [Paenibacillus albicereus]|uniref:FtsX-like permease family protein n=1 Tax=Paenibacillus albicereus TaxID=2726185 RepID=A0A6H2GXI6_9BACL|nr:FtsX-like permease family protein [Paenibacillus albicereus]QJC52115.1 FtsX-like permease family protein [Paenibacillus albicereus]